MDEARKRRERDYEAAREQLTKHIGGRRFEGFVAVDIHGKLHDLDYVGAHVSTKRATDGLWQVIAGYDPKAEAGEYPEEPVKFLVTNAEHDRMLQSDVVEEVDGENIGVMLAQRLDQIVRGTGGTAQ